MNCAKFVWLASTVFGLSIFGVGLSVALALALVGIPQMVAQTLVETASHTLCADLQTRLIGYASRVEDLRTPTEVLDDLCAITTSGLPLSVLGAVRLPLKSNDWESIQLGKSMFLHRDVPKGWWEEYGTVAQGKFRPQLFSG